jgi:hypothetical protein
MRTTVDIMNCRPLTPETRTTTLDLSIDMTTATLLALPVTLGMLASVLGAHAVVHGENALSALIGVTGVWLAAPALLLSLVIHELLHSAAAIWLAKLRWSDVSFGMHWKTLTPYAHPRVPITARVYAVSAAAPGLILGLAPAVIGLTTGNGAWSGYGALMLAAAGGDALVVWSLRGVRGTALVQDHPSRVGCHVISDGAGVSVMREAAPGMSAATLVRGVGYAFIAGLLCGSVAAIAVLLT